MPLIIFSSVFVSNIRRKLLFIAEGIFFKTNLISKYSLISSFNFFGPINHVWVALNEIIEVQNASNQWLHFAIELNSRLFAFHISPAELPYRISLVLSRPKPEFLLLAACTCLLLVHTSSLLISCSWFMNVILHMEILRFFIKAERDKCKLLNAHCQPGWWLCTEDAISFSPSCFCSAQLSAQITKLN